MSQSNIIQAARLCGVDLVHRARDVARDAEHHLDAAIEHRDPAHIDAAIVALNEASILAATAVVFANLANGGEGR